MSPRPRIRWCLWRVVACLGVLVITHALPSGLVESGFSRGYYPWLQGLLVPLFGAIPFPVMGVALVAAPPILAVLTWRRWRRGRDEDLPRKELWKRGALRALRIALYLYVIFMLFWGLGYRRVTIEERWRLGEDLPTAQQVRDVQAQLVALIRRDCPAPTDSGAPSESDYDRALASIIEAETSLVAELEDFTPRFPRHIKHPPKGSLVAIGIYGIVSPFTLEANVDVALPPWLRLGISGHELAHLAGYCGEADANLVGFVAGLRAEDPYARYATALNMLRFALSRKHLADARWALRNLPKRAREDFRRKRVADETYRVPVLPEVTNAVNHQYLKTQGVTRGVGDYARGYTLFVLAVQRGLVDLPPPLSRTATPK